MNNLGFTVIGFFEGNPNPISVTRNLANLRQAVSHADDCIYHQIKRRDAQRAKRDRARSRKHLIVVPPVAWYSVLDEAGVVVYRTQNAPASFQVIPHPFCDGRPVVKLLATITPHRDGYLVEKVG